jgi:hypothetical protein
MNQSRQVLFYIEYTFIHFGMSGLAKTFFFCLTLGQTGTGLLSYTWPLCLSHHFFVILYITCQILFFIQN